MSGRVAAIRLWMLLVLPVMAMAATPARAQDDNHVVLGAGVAATPAYQGSEDYRLLPVPAIDIKQGWFFANLRNGIGVAPIDTEALTIGASAVFVQGIRRRDLPEGIGKVSDAAGARLFASLRTGGFVATLGGTRAFGGTKGTIVDASLSYPAQISSRFTLIPTIGTTWADRKHSDRYFGITSAESLASGLPGFDAGSGFKDISGALTASYRLTDHITLSATGVVTSLLGDAKDSPLVEKKTQPSGILALAYSF
ncbi:MAG: MipA/OmpV family protein [Sphingobium sp.]